MGYDVVITRRKDRSDEADRPEITEAEWAKVGGVPTELREVARCDGGEICVKDPSANDLVEMVRIASSLNAVVEGDDGERFTLAHDGTLLTDGRPLTQSALPTGRWWFFVGVVLLVLSFAITIHRIIRWILD